MVKTTCPYLFSIIIMLNITLRINAQLNPSVSPEDFSTRQVHLDFHTSGQIEGIGKKFNKKEWQDALKGAKVNSINIFAKGHHGYSYYPTEYGTQHPHLDFDLMGTQVEACHEIGIKCPFYFTVGWSVLDSEQHPEWLIKDKNGTNSFEKRTKNLNENDAMPIGTWALLMPEGGYLDLILKQTEELCKNYDVDGFWYDIIPNNVVNYNEFSREGMKKAGIDINDEDAVNAHHVEKIKFFMASCNTIIKKYHPDASIFYNWSTHMSNSNTFKHRLYDYDTSYDLEDLPTTWAGYDVFPLRAKYFANEERPMTGMSGKFHTSWGEFGGFKYPNALKYESASMMAFGANVNFGDQLHPSGQIDPETYNNIGVAYNYVEKIEDYSVGGTHKARTGLWMTFDNKTEIDANLLLLETHTNYVVVNNINDWSDIEVIVIPSQPSLSKKDAGRFQKYLAQGGKLIVLGEGALKTDRSGFALNVGGEYLGEAEYDIDYTVVTDALSEDVVSTPFLNYIPAIKVKPDADAIVLAYIREPYFSRTKAHYSSHRNTPYRMENAEHPAIYQKGNIVVITTPLDRMYKEYGAQIHRELFENVLKRMLTQPFVTANLPSSGRLNLLHFPEKERYVVHLLYGSPVQRGIAKIIEDLVPIRNTEVTIDVEQNIKKAYLIPGKKELKIKKEGSRITVVVPEFSCHTAVVFE